MSHRGKLILSFTTVCLAWGASYFAISIGLKSMPPFLMGFLRYGLAGAFLWAWCEVRGLERPTVRQWISQAILGMLFVVLGNGTVLWVEQTVPSGITALIVAIGPLWTILLEWALGMRRRPNLASWIGLVLGASGVTLLVGGTGAGTVAPLPIAVLVLGTIAWSLGSNLSLKFERPASPLRAVSAQMITGAFVLGLMGLATGEAGASHWGHVGLPAILALGYLILVASISAYIAYGWLIHNVSPTAAGACSYVNPAIAVLLGAAFGEPIGGRQFGALAMILIGVSMLSRAELKRTKAPEPVALLPEELAGNAA